MDAAGVKAGMIIGELGAGRGRFTVHLARRVGPKGKILANDIDAEGLAYLRERCKRAGIDNPNPQRRNVTPQLLRHTFAHHYLKHEGEIQTLAYILGHSSVSTTYSAYQLPSQEGIAGEYRKIVQEMEM